MKKLFPQKIQTLICNTTNANMQPPKSKQDKNSKRTLTTLANKLKAFREAGNDVKFAKFHDNVIHDVMFNVELDQFDAFIASQSRIRDLEQQMADNNKTIEMIRSAAHNLVLQQPEKEKEISERFEPRLKHFTEELQKNLKLRTNQIHWLQKENIRFLN